MRVPNAAAALRNAWGGEVQVDSIPGSARFAIRFAGVPQDACIRLATIDAGAAEVRRVGVSIDGKPQSRSVTLGDAQAACPDAPGGNVMVFTYE